jgi:hypothetical protein
VIQGLQQIYDIFINAVSIIAHQINSFVKQHILNLCMEAQITSCIFNLKYHNFENYLIAYVNSMNVTFHEYVR